MKKRSWTQAQLIEAVAQSKSYRQVLQKIRLREAGGNYEQIKKYIKEYKLSTHHFHGQRWNKGLKGLYRTSTPLKKILKKYSSFQSYKLKRKLFAAGLKPQHCELCGWAKLSVDGRLPLELDHINGYHHDNRLENLRILCPNCHSLQTTHRGRNQRLYRKKNSA